MRCAKCGMAIVFGQPCACKDSGIHVEADGQMHEIGRDGQCLHKLPQKRKGAVAFRMVRCPYVEPRS